MHLFREKYIGRGYCNTKEPYIYPKMYENFITEKEAKYIINKSEPIFRESKLVSGYQDNIRKSESAWLSKNDTVIATIIKKVCEITKIPFENAEKIQVVKYRRNGFFTSHFDASCDDMKECVEFEKN